MNNSRNIFLVLLCLIFSANISVFAKKSHANASTEIDNYLLYKKKLKEFIAKDYYKEIFDGSEIKSLTKAEYYDLKGDKYKLKADKYFEEAKALRKMAKAADSDKLKEKSNKKAAKNDKKAKKKAISAFKYYDKSHVLYFDTYNKNIGTCRKKASKERQTFGEKMETKAKNKFNEAKDLRQQASSLDLNEKHQKTRKANILQLDALIAQMEIFDVYLDKNYKIKKENKKDNTKPENKDNQNNTASNSTKTSKDTVKNKVDIKEVKVAVEEKPIPIFDVYENTKTAEELIVEAEKLSKKAQELLTQSNTTSNANRKNDLIAQSNEKKQEALYHWQYAIKVRILENEIKYREYSSKFFKFDIKDRKNAEKAEKLKAEAAKQLTEAKEKLELAYLKKDFETIKKMMEEAQQLKLKATTKQFEAYNIYASKGTQTATAKTKVRYINKVVNYDLLSLNLILKIQVGSAEKNSANVFEAYDKIPNLTCQRDKKANKLVFFAGEFTSLKKAETNLNKIKKTGYNDAFIVAYKDGKKISLKEAKRLLKTPTRKKNTAKTKVPEKANKITLSNSKVNFTEKLFKDNTNPEAIIKGENINNIQGLVFSVQIKIAKEAAKSKDLNNIRPIYEDKSQKGKIRYEAGIYQTVNKAIKQKEKAQDFGSKDAFVTAFYNGKRVSIKNAKELQSGKTVATPKEILPKQTKIDGKIIFKVQAATLSKELSLKARKNLITASNGNPIEEFKDNKGKTIIYIGEMNKYSDAISLKNKISKKGFKGCFVVAFNNDKRVSVKAALKSLEK